MWNDGTYLMGWQQADQIIGDIKAKATLDVFVL
jgi:hypothetical protein